MTSIVKQTLLRIMLKNIVGSPGKEFEGRPLKRSCSNISKTVNNSWTLVELNMFIFMRPLIWYQEKVTGPRNEGLHVVGLLIFFIIIYLNHILRNFGFQGPRNQIFWVWKECSILYVTIKLALNGPGKEFKGRPLWKTVA